MYTLQKTTLGKAKIFKSAFKRGYFSSQQGSFYKSFHLSIMWPPVFAPRFNVQNEGSDAVGCHDFRIPSASCCGHGWPFCQGGGTLLLLPLWVRNQELLPKQKLLGGLVSNIFKFSSLTLGFHDSQFWLAHIFQNGLVETTNQIGFWHPDSIHHQDAIKLGTWSARRDTTLGKQTTHPLRVGWFTHMVNLYIYIYTLEVQRPLKE